jgi:hypothetical protein
MSFKVLFLRKTLAIFALVKSILTLIYIMVFALVKFLNECSTKLRTVKLFISASIYVLKVFLKRDFSVKQRASCFCALNNQWISNLHKEFDQGLGFHKRIIALGAQIMAIFTVLPLFIAIFTTHSHLTFSTKKWIVCKLIANSADVLI